MGLFDRFLKSKASKERRKRSNEKIKEYGIACFEDLPTIPDSNEVEVKDIDDICKRAIACLFTTQLATDILENQNSNEDDFATQYNMSKRLYEKLIEKFKSEDAVLPKERILFTNKYNKNIATDIFWTYESYWSLVWALGLIDDDEMEMPDSGCDLKTAMELVASCRSYEEFRAKCSLRDTDEILDMLDLYYRYHWACEEKKVGDPKTNIGTLDPFVVLERRRGLEWLISDENDWNNIQMDT